MEEALPQMFATRHGVCLEAVGRLRYLVQNGIENNEFLTRIPLGDESERALYHEDPWKWLESKRSTKGLGTVLLKTVFPSLVIDFCAFVGEALSCSQRGELTVAYALLRKPLQENLHFLEWLAAHPTGMLNTLYNRRAVERAMGRLRSIRNES